MDWPAGIAKEFEAAGLRYLIYHDLSVLESKWRDVEKSDACTIFQTFDWCQSWLATVGANESVQPLIVVLLAENSQFAALLPFQIRPTFLGNRLEWLTSPQLVYGYGIFSQSALQQNLQETLSTIIRIAKVSSVHLDMMPANLFDTPHPFHAHFNCKDADCTTLLKLQPDYESLLHAKRSSDSRKNIRWRDSKIAAAGDLSVAEERSLDALYELLSDQAKRLSEMGISDPARNRVDEFLARLIQSKSQCLSVLRVKIGDHGIASLLLAKHGDVVVDLMTSLADTDLRRYSPGDLALRKSIELACQQGFKTFDFSVGAAAYKTIWADQSIDLHHIVQAVGWRGLIDAAPKLFKITLKRIVKNNAALKQLAYAVRRLVR